MYVLFSRRETRLKRAMKAILGNQSKVFRSGAWKRFIALLEQEAKKKKGGSHWRSGEFPKTTVILYLSIGSLHTLPFRESSARGRRYCSRFAEFICTITPSFIISEIINTLSSTPISRPNPNHQLRCMCTNYIYLEECTLICTTAPSVVYFDLHNLELLVLSLRLVLFPAQIPLPEIPTVG